jgi:hypothetical protein
LKVLFKGVDVVEWSRPEYIYIKPPDEYPWQGLNSFNSGIFVILKKIVNLELLVTFIKKPVFAGS